MVWKLGLALLIITVGVMGWGGIAGYSNYVAGIHYQAAIGDYYQLSDSATTPTKKLFYWDQYMQAIRDEGLDTGVNSVFNTEKPLAKNANIYSLAEDIRAKLVQWEKMNFTENAGSYKLIQEEITWQDYCWYPRHGIKQAFMLEDGAWGAALFPVEQVDFCEGERPAHLQPTVNTK